ncbi:MarR family winged helix-turn-helix transcriptional regulator [Metabacillus arenae]|uniref:Winged helix-turn-helix transcriptional regulator n=1 Tax=Metabacillus arenae TaxID=2771434 RepID=A0A926S0M0_9BACI|nr:MarR family winged helix-turn-helix transcriptional regulator [Metabacillus arenae]MBD1383432.1 winged helix-turn-helix transcriptional regulator [Metabacillus arenae]
MGSICLRRKKSHHALAGQMLRKIGLFAGQEIIIMQLRDQDGQSQNCLGRTLGVDHSTVAKTVRRLEDAGLVTRSRSKEDGRVTIVSLTQAGRDLQTKVLGVWSSLERITTEDLTEQEKELLVILSQKIAPRVNTALDHNKGCE